MNADTWAPIMPAPRPLPAKLRHNRLGTPSAIWHYTDAAGDLLFIVARFDPPGARKEILPMTCGADGWRWKAPPAPRPLYGLHRLAAHPAAPVLVVEGEKVADAAAQAFPDLVPIAWLGGAQAVAKAEWSALQGRRVAIWPDNDQPGRKAAADVVKAATAAGAASVVLLDVPADWPDGWDLADTLPEGVTADTLRVCWMKRWRRKPKAHRPAIGCARMWRGLLQWRQRIGLRRAAIWRSATASLWRTWKRCARQPCAEHGRNKRKPNPMRLPVMRAAGPICW